jgi:hypothetical protein
METEVMMSNFMSSGLGILLSVWLLFAMGAIAIVLSMIHERAERLRKNGYKEISLKKEFKPMFSGAVLFYTLWFAVLALGVIVRRW